MNVRLPWCHLQLGDETVDLVDNEEWLQLLSPCVSEDRDSLTTHPLHGVDHNDSTIA